MNKTTENLIQVLKEYTPPESIKTIYRLVYDEESGKPIRVTTEPTSDTHIEISQEEASSQPQLDPRVKVENGKLVRHIKKIIQTEETNRLGVTRDVAGNIATDDYSMLIINSTGKNKWSLI